MRAAAALFLLSCIIPTGAFLISAQTTNGRLEGSVRDPQGALIPAATIKVIQVDTGRPFDTTSNDSGEWVIPFVPTGNYKVTVTAPGFKAATVSQVKVDAGSPATVNVVLEIGSLAETVEVQTGAEVLQTTNSSVSTTIVGRQINQLPQMTRNALELVLTQPGTATPGTPRTSSINGLPKASLNVTLDGVNIQDNLLKSSDGFFATIMPKPDAIEEVTVSTAGVTADLAGEGAAQVRYVTRSGTNTFKGGLFWQHRNDYFNSNYYFNSVNSLARDRMILNQYGGRLGGPIKKDKVFFFVNHEEFKLPQTYRVPGSGSQTWLTDTAMQGIFAYQDSAGQVRQINLYQLAAQANAGLSSSIRPFSTTPDPIVAAAMQRISSLTKGGGNIQSRILTNNDYNRFNYTFNTPGNNKRSFPTVKLDYNITTKHHVDFVVNYQKYLAVPDAVNSVTPILPGTGTVLGNDTSLGTRRISFSGTFAWRASWTPTLTSEFRYGLTGGNSLFRDEMNSSLFSQSRGYYTTYNFTTSPYTATGASRRNSPVRNLSATITKAQKNHLLNFGGTFTEINLFQQSIGSQVIPGVSFAIAANDPINTGSTSIFTAANFPNSTPTNRSDAAAMYALLTGRISSITRSAALSETTGKYEPIGSIDRNKQREFSMFVQDSWRVRPGFTLNYGLRWNVQFPFRNLSGIYTTPGAEGSWGVSGVGNLFVPGVMTGQVPAYVPVQTGEGAYRTYWNQFSPSLGFAWVAPGGSGWIRKLTGGPGKTVIRAGASVSTIREGSNTFVNIYGSNQGRSVSLSLTPANNPAEFGAPGSVLFRDANLPVRPFVTSPQFPLGVIAGQSVNDFDSNLRPGYVSSWTLSVQREIGRDTVIDVRYVGNHGTGLWRQVDLNEVNIIENGFLKEFNVAAQNLAIARRTSPNSTNFGNQGLAGQSPIPIIRTALGLDSDQAFADLLIRGQAGNFANNIASNAARMGRLTAAGYPANLFYVNPTVVGGGSYLMTNLGHSTFNSLQVEARRRMARGLLLQGSYVWSKSLTNMQASSSAAFSQPTTFRDPGIDKGPSPWDLRHAFKVNYIFELPFGPGRKFLSNSHAIVKRAVEGWELSSAVRIQSGSPLRITSGRGTLNQYDAGVVLHNITRKELQDMVGIRKSGNPIVYWLPQSIIDNTMAAFEVGGRTLNQVDATKPYVGPPTSAGDLGYRLFLYGPWTNYIDMSILKRIPITEKQNFEVRANFLNLPNTPNFLLGSAGNDVNSSGIGSGFGQTTSAFRDLSVSGSNHPGSRVIEFQLRYNF